MRYMHACIIDLKAFKLLITSSYIKVKTCEWKITPSSKILIYKIASFMYVQLAICS